MEINLYIPTTPHPRSSNSIDKMQCYHIRNLAKSIYVIAESHQSSRHFYSRVKIITIKTD